MEEAEVKVKDATEDETAVAADEDVKANWYDDDDDVKDNWDDDDDDVKDTWDESSDEEAEEGKFSFFFNNTFALTCCRTSTYICSGSWKLPTRQLFVL